MVRIVVLVILYICVPRSYGLGHCILYKTCCQHAILLTSAMFASFKFHEVCEYAIVNMSYYEDGSHGYMHILMLP